MRLFRLKSLPLFLMFAMLPIYVLQACGQFPSVGNNPGSSYQNDDLDSVDLASGNVNVHIPLIGFPQRGGYIAYQWKSIPYCSSLYLKIKLRRLGRG